MSLRFGLVTIGLVLLAACQAGVDGLEPGAGPLGRPGPEVEAAARDQRRCRLVDAHGYETRSPFDWWWVEPTWWDAPQPFNGELYPPAVREWSELACSRDADCVLAVVSACPSHCSADFAFGPVAQSALQRLPSRRSSEFCCRSCGYVAGFCPDLADWAARCVEGVCLMCAR